MLNASEIKFFKQNGYLILDRPIMDKGRLESLRGALDKVLSGQSAGAPDLLHNMAGEEMESENVVIQVVNVWQAETEFRDLIYDPLVTSMIAQLVGDDTLRLWHDQIQFKPPRVGSPTDWHQDHPYWPVIEPADLISCWIALDDATVENGCMNVVPGSHMWGPAPGGLRSDESFHPVYEPEAVPEGSKVEVVSCEVKAGSCMFHHCLTWHGSYYNRSDKSRRAVALHFMPGYTRYVPKADHVEEQFITVEPGEILQGDHFPTVYQDGHPLQPEMIGSR